MIISGQLMAGDALPSMRTLAKDLRISVITTKRAYNDLEQEGFIETITGKGSFVAARNTEVIREGNLRMAEEHLTKAAEIARRSGISYEELCEVLKMLYDGE
jgi:GntR family transcriptional regulator